MNRKLGYAALLAVVGVSIVFGMILGGRLNAPQVMFAARDVPARAVEEVDQPAAATATTGFADIVDGAIPAVVGVISTSVAKTTQGNPHDMFRDDPFFRFFFGPPDRRNNGTPRGQRQEPKIQSGGSGFIVSRDGYILTNNHVVEDATKVDVYLKDGSKHTAQVVGTDPNIDLALLKIDAKGDPLPTLALGDSDKLRVGQWVIAIGNPFQLSETVTVGVVSAKNRQFQIGDADASLSSFIQTDAAINLGNSGGPLIDASGRVVGINTAIRRGEGAEGIGFALPINQAKSAMEQLRATGKVRRGYLGIQMTDVTDNVRDYNGLPDRDGVLVQSVTEGGPSAKAEIAQGDIIRKLDGVAVKDGRDLVSRIAARKPGDRVELELIREGKPRTVSVALAVRPDANQLEESRQGGGEEQPEGEEQGGPTAEALGFRVERLTPGVRQELELPGSVQGVVVTDVDPGSDAADEGIQMGLVITAVGDKPIRGLEDWRQAVKGLKPGSVVKLRVQQGEQSALRFLKVPTGK